MTTAIAPAAPQHPDAAVFDLCAAEAAALKAAHAADDADADARYADADALLDALLATLPVTPEGRRAQAEAIAPHYQKAGDFSDRVAACAFAALGVDLMALAEYGGGRA